MNGYSNWEMVPYRKDRKLRLENGMFETSICNLGEGFIEFGPNVGLLT